MTLPDERTRAVIYTRKFLRDLLQPKITPRVPREVRDRAANLLRHYPWDLHISLASKSAPVVFDDPYKEDEDR